MAWYVLVGHIPQNKSGVGARGYQLFRRGTVVYCRYGKIVVSGGMTSTFRWAHHVTNLQYRCRTANAAKQKKKSIERKLDGYYSRLPEGVTIRSVLAKG
jgi:hypothetical protein